MLKTFTKLRPNHLTKLSTLSSSLSFSTTTKTEKDLLSYYTNDTGSIDDCETIIIGFTDIYGRLLGKRMDKDFYIDSVLKDGTHGCNYLLTCDMDMNPQNGFQFSNWEGGYGDFHLVPDHKTFKKLSWLNKTGIILSDIYDPINHKPVNIAPRSMLKNEINKLNNEGYNALAATELEYYMYNDSYKNARNKNYNNLNTCGEYMEDYHILAGTKNEKINNLFRKHLKLSGIPVESSKGEAGIGQNELNIKYSNILDMADKHVLYKQCLKEVAILNEMSVTFMCKPYTDATGSGCHIHLSLWDNKTNTNIFKGPNNIGRLKGCSKIFEHFLGGWIKYTPELFPFYAPTNNSYKRFVSGSWAPTKLAWSFDNRTAGFRIVGDGNSLRIEMRICGSDINPYLVFTASLASGINGIKNEIELDAPFDGNIYDCERLNEIPKSFKDSIRMFEGSEFANKVLGEDVVSHYAKFYSLELDSFNKVVTDWERNRYFEMI